MVKRDVWEKLSTLLIVAICVWIVWSWLEIVAHNRTDCQYSACNALMLLFKIFNIAGV